MSITKQERGLPPARRSRLFCVAILLLVGGIYARAGADFHFALLGDRTGEAQTGVFEEACREMALEKPAFILTVGDAIQGGDDRAAAAEWEGVTHLLEPYRNFKFYFTPGNHDVWSEASAAQYQAFAKRPLHYSFDYEQAHFTVLNNSLSDQMPESELTFLQSDLEAHANAPVKFVISHRPSWLFSVVMGNPNFPFHQLVKKYGVKYVIAGHIHQMLHLELDGITYLSMASSGGHLRNDKAYEHGWFFQHTDVTVHAQTADFKIEELPAPFGQGRISKPSDWGPAGLVAKTQ